MNKEEYLSIIDELKESDSIKRRIELRKILWKRLKPTIEYFMSQRYCSGVADWRVEDGPAYYEDSVYVDIDYHIPRLSRESVQIDINLEDFLDDNYVDRLKEEERIKRVDGFNYQI